MFQENISLKDKTTLKVGGPAEFFVAVQTEAELIAAVQKSKEQELRISVLGGGSNVLVDDDGVKGLVIKNEISGWEEVIEGTDVLVTVGAGELLDTTVAQAVEKGYWGIENLSHIPGSVGATPVQNVGAYDVEVKDVVTAVRALNTDTMEFETLDNEACRFGYRDSLFKQPEGKKYIVVAVTYKLSTQPQPNIVYKDLKARFGEVAMPDIAAIREAVIEIRGGKFPDWHTVGTAGSFFKNPIIPRELFTSLKETYPEMPGYELPDDRVKVPLGWVLDHVCELRGTTRGHVGSYEGQALVIVHDGHASAHDVTEFAELVRDTVREKTGIEVEWEVTRLGSSE